MWDSCWSSQFLKDCTPWKGTMLEQFVKNCRLRAGIMKQKFIKTVPHGWDPTLEQGKGMRRKEW